ncbi:penicillin-binding protein 1A [Senegalia massiliensis]|uniref:penicillin-binding protein 1A n=1 Tax=Senegalia massiliensis TaxID=1720316 RepID=UPI001031460C|nr:PBP1A family penicillin-binding protein [Senegalia massiliensis]
MSNEKNTKRDKTKKDKSKKDNKRRNIILKTILVVFLLFVFISVGTVGGILFGVIKDSPEINPSRDINALSENSKIYDQNGTLIEEVLTEEKRTIVNLEDMSPFVKDAFVSVEDERFREHFGIDLKGIARAIVVDIKTRSLEEGASTITQQLVRNLYLTKEKVFTRKITEMYLAVKMEREISKDDILEAYLNTIYLGQGAYGVEAASKTYFNKDAKDLTLAESALLAGITKSPNDYQLFKRIDPENLEEDNMNVVGTVEVIGKQYVAVFNENIINRQKTILSLMKEQGKITEEEYNEALDEDVVSLINPGQMKNENIETSYYTDFVKNQVKKDLISKAGYTEEEAEEALFKDGLKIYTTVDIEMQEKIEDIYKSFTENVGSKSWLRLNYKTRGGNIIDSYGKIAYYQKENLLDNEGNLYLSKDSYNIDEQGNLTIKSPKINYRNLDVTDYFTKKDGTIYTHPTWSLSVDKQNYTVNEEDESFTIKAEYLKEHSDFYKIVDNTLYISKDRFYNNEKGVIQPQSAITIMDPKTGQVKAIVGGRDSEGQRVFNRATNGPRQPGSSIKPLSIYTPALDNGFTAASVIDDVPRYSNGKIWPKNYSTGRFYGLTPMRKAIQYSYNVSAVKFLEKVGINSSIDYLTKFGLINKDNPSNDTFISADEAINGSSDENLAALALGGMTKGVTPLKMTAAYGALANNGVYTEPIVYTKIENNKGEVIIDNKPKQNTVVSPQIAYIMTDMLQTVVNSGSGTNANFANMSVAGKTGTTNNQVDVWFAGYTPYYSAAVWIGNDSPAIELTQSSKLASSFWGNIMKTVHEGLDNQSFKRPEGIVSRQVCIDSGKLPTELCSKDPRGSRVRTELFVAGTEPRERCDVHVSVEVDTSTGKLANEYCPDDVVENRVFIQRPVPYKGSIKPIDSKYEVPTEVCDVHTKDSNPIKDIIDDILDKDKDEDKDKEDDKKPDKDKEDNGNSDDNGGNEDDGGDEGTGDDLEDPNNPPTKPEDPTTPPPKE